MQKLFVEGEAVVNLPGDQGFEVSLFPCESRGDFTAWCSGDGSRSMAARHEGRVYVKIPRRIESGGEFSLDYDCLSLEEANARIESWNAGQSD